MLRFEMLRAAALTAMIAVPYAAGCGAEPVDTDSWDAAVDDGVSKASACDDRCSATCRCEVGEGDCDSDRDCVAGLFCPPDGPGIERCQARSTPSTSCAGKCSPTCRCSAGQGDCDSNSDCAAGLVCPPDGPGTELCQASTGGGGGSGNTGGSAGEGSTGGKGELKIVVFSVGSADSALIVLPTGATMLVDSATASRAKSRVIPFLKRHGINRLNYYVETHPHPDHEGGREPLRSAGFITSSTQMWDWKGIYAPSSAKKTFQYGTTLNLEGTKVFIYNHRDTSFHGTDTNYNSLSFRMEYNGFVYSTTGDEGTKSQRRFLEKNPSLVRAHVRNTAHHLWGPVLPAFDKATDPVLFIVSSENSVKEESSWRTFMNTVDDMKKSGKRVRKVAFTPSDGHVIVRARDGNDWNYSFCSALDSCIVPNLR